VGIAEEFAVTYAAGMAAGGLKPVVAMYSTFLQRAYDQVMHDVCLQNLPVVFCLDRSGVVGKDGKTHQGVFDFSFLTHVPNLRILAPSNVNEFKDALEYAMELNAPVVIRYPKNSIEEREVLPYKDALWEKITDGDKLTVLAVGPRMLDIAKKFAQEVAGVRVICARTVKPLCEKTLDEISNLPVITLEENSVIGGFGSLVNGYYAQKGYSTKVINLGIKDDFVRHGSVDKQLKENGLTVENLKELTKNLLGEV